ncbi:MAG: type II toxin-antitoxin system HicA family toxin [Solirubrobacteraceae bacterium]
METLSAMPLKVREAIKLIEADGWQPVATKGDHRQFKHPTKPARVTIAGRMWQDLKPKTEASILRQAGFAPMTNASDYLILIEGDGTTNYSAWSPDLPGCVAAADTVAQTVTLMREAIAFQLEGLAEDGDPAPKPSGPGVYIEAHPVAA